MEPSADRSPSWGTQQGRHWETVDLEGKYSAQVVKVAGLIRYLNRSLGDKAWRPAEEEGKGDQRETEGTSSAGTLSQTAFCECNK